MDQAGIKALILEKMAGFALTRGALTPEGQPVGALGHNYLAWSNSLRHDLLAFGLDRRIKQVTDLRALLAKTPEDTQEKVPVVRADG